MEEMFVQALEEFATAENLNEVRCLVSGYAQALRVAGVVFRLEPSDA